MRTIFTVFLMVLLPVIFVTAQVVQVNIPYTFVGGNGSCGGGPGPDAVAAPQAKGKSSPTAPNATNAGCNCASTGDDFQYTQYGINGNWPDMHDVSGNITYTHTFTAVGVNTTSVYTQTRRFRKWWKPGFGCVTETVTSATTPSYRTVYVEAGLAVNPPANVCPTSTPIDITTWTNKTAGFNKASMTYTLDGGPVLNVAANPIIPSALTPGIHNIVVTYPFDTPDNVVAKSFNIATNPTSTISASFPTDVCAISGQTVNLNSFVSNPQPSGSIVTFNCVPGGGHLCPSGVLSGGVYNPFAQGGNSFTSKIEVITTSPQGCVTTVEKIIKVGKDFTITPGPTIGVCKDAAQIPLGGSPLNGSSNGESGTYTALWSGPGVTGTNFDPSSGAVVGGGSYTLTYEVNSNMGCIKSATRTANVNPAPVLSVGGVVPHIADCASGNLDLVSTYIPRNGGVPVSTGLTWSSSNSTVNSKISGGILSLSGIPLGNYNITFSYVNGFGCTKSYTITNALAINTGAIAVPNANNETNCGLGLSTTLAVLSPDMSVSYDWYDVLSGGSVIHTGTNFVTPSLSANTSYYVAARKASCVSSRKQVNITVVNTNVTAGADYSSCDNNTGSVNLSGLNNPNPSGGTWAGPGVSGGNFNGGSLANNQSYELVYTVNQYGCISRDTILATLGFNIVLTYDPSNEVYPGEQLIIKHNYPTATKTVWQFGDGTSIEALNGAHYYYQEGLKNISVYIKQPAGCENTFTFTDAVLVKQAPLITATEKGIVPVEVFPIPVEHSLKMKSEATMNDLGLVLWDMNGRTVGQAKINVSIGETEILPNTIPSLKPGLYILSITHAGNVKQIKLLKK